MAASDGKEQEVIGTYLLRLIYVMASIPPLPENWADQKPYLGNVNKLGATNLTNEILAATDSPPSFRFVVCRILEKLIEENNALAFENDCPVPRIAWATRNIMELRILARYVCLSQANVDRFQNDVLTVGATTLRSMARLYDGLRKESGGPPMPPALYRNQGELQSARDEAGLGQESALIARTCARKVGLEKEFLALSSVTSPLVHPSAISVLKTFDLEAYRAAVTAHGLMLASNVILDARGHIAQHGYKPAA